MVFGVNGLNGAISSFTKAKMAIGRNRGKFNLKNHRNAFY